ncbi:MAG: hypothetical protein WDN08_20530 [Rhizomicrobium sp.]
MKFGLGAFVLASAVAFVGTAQAKLVGSTVGRKGDFVLQRVYDDATGGFQRCSANLRAGNRELRFYRHAGNAFGIFFTASPGINGQTVSLSTGEGGSFSYDAIPAGGSWYKAQLDNNIVNPLRASPETIEVEFAGQNTTFMLSSAYMPDIFNWIADCVKRADADCRRAQPIQANPVDVAYEDFFSPCLTLRWPCRRGEARAVAHHPVASVAQGRANSRRRKRMRPRPLAQAGVLLHTMKRLMRVVCNGNFWNTLLKSFGMALPLNAKELAALDRWTVPKFDYIPDAAIAEVRDHPRFGDALRHVFINVLEHGARDKAHARVFHDVERFVLGVFALYLDVTGGITHRRLRELGSEGGMMSSGRATAILMYMRTIGYVVPSAKGAKGQVRRYEATRTLYETYRTRMRFEFEAAAMVDPTVASVASRLDDPDTFRAVCTHLAETLRYATRGGRPEFALVDRIASRRAGMSLLYSLFLSLDDGGAFPRGGELTVNVKAAAHRFGVSRAQILGILKDLEHYVRGRNGDTLDAAFVETFARWYAAVLVGVLHSCACVIRDRTQRTAGPAAIEVSGAR